MIDSIKLIVNYFISIYKIYKIKDVTLPNKLTLTRIFLIPVLVVLILTKFDKVFAAFLFLFAAFTDWLDGFLARMRNQVTDLGKILDPVADKLLISAAFISLVEVGKVPAWIVVTIVGREFAVTALRGIAASKNIVIQSSELGKIKMISQVFSITFLILDIHYINTISLYFALILTVISGISYFLKFWDKIGIKTY